MLAAVGPFVLAHLFFAATFALPGADFGLELGERSAHVSRQAAKGIEMSQEKEDGSKQRRVRAELRRGGRSGL